MNEFSFDCETYPNFFCVTFVDLKTDKPYQFLVSEWRDDRNELATFIRECDTLVSFNGLSFDDPVLIVFLRTYKTSRDLTGTLYRLSQRLIADSSFQDERVREVRYADRSWKSVDVMKILYMDHKGIGLKQAAINLRWPKIQDLPLPYDAEIEPEDTDLILSYNLNDAQITKAIYEAIEPERQLRDEIKQIYKVDVTNDSRSNVANSVLRKFYLKATGLDWKQLRDMRTIRSSIKLKNCIPDDIVFHSEAMQNMLAEFKDKTVYINNKFKTEYSLYFDGKVYNIKSGGLHTDDAPGIFKSDDEYTIMDADVGSYYPSVMMKNKVKPEHITDDFLNILDDLRKERLEAKHNKQTLKADALKIVINSAYGKTGSPTHWLYDPQTMLGVTVSGQLYLLMLVELLVENGFEILSANTDGLFCRVRNDRKDLFKQLCAQWAEEKQLEIDTAEYEIYVRSDVNSYIAKKKSGKIKAIGSFRVEYPSMTIQLTSGFWNPIVAKTLQAYFLENIPVEDSIYNAQDILDFCMSKKSGSQFQNEFHTKDGVEILQKTNRFYASNTGGQFWKKNLNYFPSPRKTMRKNKNTEGRSAQLKDQPVRILNDLDVSKPIEEYDIDYNFYINEVYKIIDPIKPRMQQLSFI